MTSVLLVGTGAQASYSIETLQLNGTHVVGLLSLPQDPVRTHVGSVAVLGGVDDYAAVSEAHGRPHVIVAASRTEVKERTVVRLAAAGATFASAIHPRAVVATSARLGVGVIVNATAVIQPFAVIGSHVMIHAGVIVEHDCEIADFANLAPRACVAGHVRVGRGATVYMGASVLPTRKIGAYAVVGAGAVVLSDVPDGVTVAGVPARALAVGKPSTS